MNYPANNSDTAKIYQIEFKRSSTSMHRIFTFTVSPNNTDEITVSGTVTGAPTGSILYIQRSNGLGSKTLSDGTYALKVPKNTPYRLYLKYVDETLYDETFESSSVDVVNDVNIDYDFYIEYETSLPVVDGYIQVDWDTLTIPITVKANTPWVYVDGSSTCTMTPGRGYYGTTSVNIEPYEENIYDKAMTGYVQLEDAYDYGVSTLIRWKQLPQN